MPISPWQGLGIAFAWAVGALAGGYLLPARPRRMTAAIMILDSRDAPNGIRTRAATLKGW